MYLVGNKSDLNDMREVRKDEAMTKSEKYNIAFSETSALYGDNIHKIFKDLMEKVYINFYRNSNTHKDKEINKGVDLNKENKENNNNNNGNKEETEKKCC